MKIEQVKNIEEKVIGDADSIEASISSDSMSTIFTMMSKSMYANPIGSIVREITSNCFDSHQEAGVDETVLIKKGKDEEGTYISFNDYGVGLSPERIKKVYMNYFSSTKRDTNDQIGGFGLGSKTPLSYTDSFYINTIFDGIKYNYVLSKGEKFPTLTLMNTSETTEHNGTEILIYILNTNDEKRFLDELIKQLSYFDSVYFEGWGIDNDYRIHNCNYFKYRNKDHYSKEAHIILGKVAYPIDWTQISVAKVTIPIGIKFEIGELVVTPNRESLQYTNEVKLIVSTRVKNAIDELISLFHEQNKVVDNYFEWYELKNSKPYVSFDSPVIDNDGVQEVDTLFLTGLEGIPKKHKCSILDGISFLERNNLLSKLYISVGNIYNRKVDKDSKSNLNTSSYNLYIGDTNVIKEEFAYIVGSGQVFRPIKLTKSDLKYQDEGSLFWCVTDEKKYREALKKDRINSFSDDGDEVSKKITEKYTYFNLGIAIRLYKAIKTIRLQCEQKWNLYRELTVEEKAEFKVWKDANNANLQRKLAGKVLVKDLGRYYTKSYDWKVDNTYSTKLTSQNYNNKKPVYKRIIHECGINFYKGIVVYGFRDDTNKLKKAITFLGQFKHLIEKEGRYLREKSAKVIQISQQNEKYFKGRKNMVHVDDLYSDNKLFRKLASSIKIEEYFIELGKHQSGSIDDFIIQMGNLCQGVGVYLNQLQSYYKNTSNNERISGTQIERSDLKKDILNIAEKGNLFDSSIELIFKQLDEWFKGVEIIKYTDIIEDSLPFIIKLLGDNKKKLNIEYYQKYVDSYKIDNVERSIVYDKLKQGKRIRIIQQAIQFEDIKEEQPISKLKFITNKAA